MLAPEEVAAALDADTDGTSSARATSPGWLLQVAVTITPSAGTARSAEDASVGWAVRLLTGGSACPVPPPARAPWALSGETRIASVRPTACAGHRSRAPGVPRYTAWRLKRTHTPGSAVRLNTGQLAGTTSRYPW